MSSGRICRTRTSPQHPKCRVLPLHHILYIGTLCYGSGPICLDIVIPAIDLTGYLYSLTRGVSTAAPFHGCASTVAHLSRPIGVFATFATVANINNIYSARVPMHCGCTGTDHRFRSFNDTILSAELMSEPSLLILTVITPSQVTLLSHQDSDFLYEGSSSHLFQSFSSAQRVLSDFASWGCSYQPSLGQRCLHTSGFRCLTSNSWFQADVRCRPNPCYGASNGNRTHIFCLEGRHNGHYTIPAQ